MYLCLCVSASSTYCFIQHPMSDLVLITLRSDESLGSSAPLNFDGPCYQVMSLSLTRWMTGIRHTHTAIWFC
jgi:hypothetical protein